MRMVNRYVILGVKYIENDVYYMPWDNLSL